MKQKLAIIALGKPNSGKSTTWYELIGRTIRSGWKTIRIDTSELDVYFKNSSFEETGLEINADVFFRNASFEEYGDEIEDYFEGDLPDIVFCSVQYLEKGIRTIQWFVDHEYHLHIHWINPGYCHQKEYKDFLEFETKFSLYGDFLKVSGKEKESRVEEVKKFLVTWLGKNK